MPIQLTGLWLHRDFRRLWAGETISIFGTLIGGIAMTFTAIIWLDAGAGEIAILALCQLVPGFVLGPIAGVWVDRLPRRPVMIVADVGRFAAIATIPAAALLDVLTIQHLWIAAAAASALTVFFDVAYQSYLPTLVTDEELLEGNSKLEASASVAEIGAFGISGWLVQLITAPGALLVDAVSFLASAFAVARIESPEPPPPPPHEREHLAREAFEGLAYVVRKPVLRALAVATSLYSISSRLITVVLLLYLNKELGFSAGVLGMIFAVGGATSIIGAFLASRSSWFGGLGPGLVVAAMLRAVGTITLVLPYDNNLLSASFLVAGQFFDSAWTFYNINELTIRQGASEPRIQGRVHASFRFVEFGAMVVGTGMAALLADLVGYRETLFVAVVFQFLAAGSLLVSPVIRVRTMSHVRPVSLEPAEVA